MIRPKPDPARAAGAPGRLIDSGLLPGLLLLACLVPLASCDSLRASAGSLILWGLLASIPYAVILYLVWRGRGSWPVLILVGLLARLLLLLPAEGPSDDLYRYLWEGRVVLAGDNPYLHPPDDPALVALRDEQIWPAVTHRDVPAAYPPLAQMLFAAVAKVSPTPMGMRLWMVLFDLIVWALLALLLRELGHDTRRSAIWGWSPLVILEVAGAAHVDVLAILFLVLALLLHRRGRPRAAVVALSLATLVKPLGLLLLPFLLRRVAWLWQLSLLVLVLVAGYLPFSSNGPPLGGLGTYAREWVHNAPVFPFLVQLLEQLKESAKQILEQHEYRENIRRLAYDFDPNLAARACVLVVCSAVILYLWRRGGSLPGRALVALALFLLLSPTIHPWYLLWLVPLLGDRLSPPLLLWTATVLLSYHVLPLYDASGKWLEVGRVKGLEYAPVLIWGAVSALAGLRPRRDRPPGPASPHEA